MNKTNSPKTIQVLNGIALLLLGGLCSLLGLAAALLPAEGTLKIFGQTVNLEGGISDSIAPWLIVAFLAVLMLDRGLWWIKNSLAMQDKGGAYEQPNLWSGLGQVLSLQGMISAGGFVIALVVALLIGLTLIVGLVTGNRLAPSWQFGMVAGILVLYFIVRKPLGVVMSKLGSGTSGLARWSLASYTLTDDGVTIDLNMKSLDKKKYLVHICFDELTEIKSFNSYLEADAFRQYEMGPNMQLLIKQAQDLARYTKGEIPRPSVYMINGVSSIGKLVLLRGPDLFYFISFAADDVSDLIQAFEKAASVRNSESRR